MKRAWMQTLRSVAKPVAAWCVRSWPLLLLAGVCVWAAWARLRLPLWPVASADVSIYLTPGLLKFQGLGFQHRHGQCFLYPGFLYLVLATTGDFRAITLVQHFLGFGSGLALFGSWLELRRSLAAPRLPAPLYQLLGVLLTGFYLLSSATIDFERTIRPEAVLPFFVLLNLYCTLRFTRLRFRSGQPERSLVSGGLAVFLSIVAVLVKPSVSALLFLANLPILISLFRPGQTAKRKTLLAGVPVCAALLLLVWPEWKLRQEDSLGRLYLAQTLFSIHADLIDEQIGEDLARHAATPYPEDFLAATHAALTDAIQRSQDKKTNYFPVLGFNADYLIQAKPSYMGELFRQLGGEEQTVAFCHYYYWRVIRRHPEKMGRKILRQMGVFYHFGGCPAYHTDPAHPLGADYQTAATHLQAVRKLRQYAPGAVFLRQTDFLGNAAQKIRSPGWIVAGGRWLGDTYLAWCLGTLALGAAVAGSRRLRSRFGVPVLVVLFVYAYNFGTVLTLAIGHSLDITRYSQYQLAYTVLPEFGAIWLGMELLAVAVLGMAAGKRASTNSRSKYPMNPPWLSQPPFADEPILSMMPRLQRPADPPPAGIVVADGGGNEEENRPASPDTRLVRADQDTAVAVLDVMESGPREVLLMIDAGAGIPVDAARALIEAYVTHPADLIVGCAGAVPRSPATLISFLLWSVFGWRSNDPLSNVWLCSRRLYQNVPLPAGRDPRAIQLAFTVQALDKGFSIREILLPGPTEPAATAHPARTAPDAGNAGMWRALAGWCFQLRPLRCFGLLGLVLLVLGFSLGYSPLRHAKEKKYRANPLRVMASAVLLLAGLLSLQTALLTHNLARLGREACQLRLRAPGSDADRESAAAPG